MQYGIANRSFNLSDVVPKIKSLIDMSHNANLQVIYSQQTGLAYKFLSRYGIYNLKRRGMDPKTARFMAEGSDDWKILDQLLPSKEDIVLKKYARSFFVGTNLDQILRGLKVDTLILTGVSTHVGIEGTARNAADLGYIPVIVEDAVGDQDKELHYSSIKTMASLYDVQNTTTVLATLSKLVRA